MIRSEKNKTVSLFNYSQTTLTIPSTEESDNESGSDGGDEGGEYRRQKKRSQNESEESLIEYFVNNNASINISNNKGWSPLFTG